MKPAVSANGAAPSAARANVSLAPIDRAPAIAASNVAREAAPARARLRGPEAEQQRGAPRHVGLEQRQRLERAREELGRLLVGEVVERALGRALRVVDGLVVVAARRGRQEVVRELRQVRVDRAAVDVLERLAGGLVGGHPLAGRHVRQ